MIDHPRFSLRMLLAFTGSVAAAMALCVAPQEWKPDWRLAVLAFIIMAGMPSTAIVGIVYCRRYGRAFSIGVLATTAWMAALVWTVMQNAETIFVGRGVSFATGKDFFVIFARTAASDVGAAAICALVVGIICVVVCWCIGTPRG